ncbi:MAG: metallophosphoesterase [Cyclobacteriaceae bacterium]|nr:metallophosphoesterase [Cyclobacteriaceae bacterium]
MNKRKVKTIYNQLDELYESSKKLEINEETRVVIFSDLHLGDGSSKDDFIQNAHLFQTAVEKYYFSKDFHLVLNGDVEELQRFSIKRIKSKWKDIYELFRRFDEKNMFHKLIGNHDLALCLPNKPESEFNILHCLTLQTTAGDMQVYHGHQASMVYEKLNKLVGYTLRYLANPFRIKNYSIAHSSRRQYAIEKRVYHYSSYRKRVSIIGHTHRPLFESMTKAERIKHKIEALCRKYIELESDDDRKSVKKMIKSHKKELNKIFSKSKPPFLAVIFIILYFMCHACSIQAV